MPAMHVENKILEQKFVVAVVSDLIIDGQDCLQITFFSIVSINIILVKSSERPFREYPYDLYMALVNDQNGFNYSFVVFSKKCYQSVFHEGVYK